MSDYDGLADAYARRRRVYDGIVPALAELGRLGPESRALEVGAGTGNHIRALRGQSGCRAIGLERSEAMLGHARGLAGGVAYLAGDAHRLPFQAALFDLVFSVDVIHHLAWPADHFEEVARVLGLGGRLVTVTQSHAQIRARPVLARYFPETVAADLARYPGTADLIGIMEGCGFKAAREVMVEVPRQLTDADAFAEKAFSVLHLIPAAAFRAGLERLEAALTEGPLPAPERFTLLVGEVRQEA
jgi:SAM-dependent methyltransferase